MNDLRKALFRALEKSDLNMLQALLAQGVSLAYEEGDPDPVCFVGATNEGLALDDWKFLHAAGADLTAREPEYQDSLLHWCVNNKDEELLPWLIAQGLDVNAKNINGRTPLVFAAYGILSSSDQNTHFCAMRDINRLIKAGADINIKDEGDTLLHKAAYLGKTQFAIYLIGCGIDANVLNAKMQTSLHHVALRSGSDVLPDHLAIIDQLIEAGADINALDEDGHSPLACTYVGNNTLIARKLIECGADVNAGSGAALRMMMDDENSEIFDMLIATGAILDIAHGDERLSPIGLAANNNCLHGIRVLLEYGIDPNVENIDGETPLLIAAWHSHHDAIELLISHGANPHHTDHYGNTALSLAKRRKDTRLIEILASK